MDDRPHPLDQPVACRKAGQFIGVTAQLLYRHINEIGRLRQHSGRLGNGLDGQAPRGVAVSWVQPEVGPDRLLMPSQGPRRGSERLEVGGEAQAHPHMVDDSCGDSAQGRKITQILHAF